MSTETMHHCREQEIVRCEVDDFPESDYACRSFVSIVLSVGGHTDKWFINREPAEILHWAEKFRLLAGALEGISMDALRGSHSEPSPAEILVKNDTRHNP